MDNIDIAKLVYDFKKNNSMLWVEGSDIQLLVADNFKSEELKNNITKFKSDIIAFLVYNSIFSKDDFLKKGILKLNSNKTFLSFAQERLWFIEQYEDGTFAYHVPSVYELDVDTNAEGIKYALKQIVSRHEVLRTTIEQTDDNGIGNQIVHNKPLSFEEVTLTETSDYKSLIKEDINRPFNLSKEYPIRAKFYTIYSSEKKQQNKILLMITMHHIVSDGWSVDLFQKELFAYYEAYSNKDITFSLPPLEIQYKDCGVWQKNYLIGSVLEKQLSFWKEKLSGYQPLELQTDYPRPNKPDYKGGYNYFTINKKVSNKLRSFTQRYGVTLHSVMLSSFNILLSKYTGQEDIITGSPIANRQHRQTQELIGFFVNTQVNRALLNNNQSFSELIEQVHHDQIESQLHQDLPFEKLVDELGVDRDPSRHPVFQVLIGVQSFGTQNNFSNKQKKYLKRYQAEDYYQVERFDLTILIDDSQEELIVQLSYATSLFHKDTIERFVSHYKRLLDELTQAPDKPYSAISLLNPWEYDQIINEWNATDKEFPKEKTFYQLFQEQVEKTPENIAIVHEGNYLTYKELNEKSNQLAHYIRTRYRDRTNQTFMPDTLIALCLDRSLEMAIGILAILKAGGAYVPIDPSYPKERIDYMLEDTEAVFVLTKKYITEGAIILPKDKTINIDLNAELYRMEDHSNLSINSTPQDLAYVIYTSGSTGKPKGAMIEHQGMVNHLYAKIDLLDLNETSIVAQNASQCFDISVWQFMAALVCGGKVIIYEGDLVLNPSKFLSRLKDDATNILEVVPSYLSALIDLIESNIESNLRSIKCLLVTGEELKADLVKRWFSIFPGKILINAYGPTEASDDITHHVISTCGESKLVPVGKTIQNLKIYIVNNDMQLCPIGIIGEICVSGVGVGRGYLNNFLKTKEVFVNDPFSKEKTVRLYKTGDVGKWLPDGNIQYLGRKDDQVKIRGYRIELGEIEHAITQLEGIGQACVLVKERKAETSSTKYLVAYYVSDKSNYVPNKIVIREKLSEMLPEYMLPSVFLELLSFPLSANGKLDKKSLPDPDFSSLAESYTAPVTEKEIIICNIWQVALGLDKVGVADDFFKIGGNSVLAIQVSHRMSKALGCNVKVSDIFKLKNVNMLVEKFILSPVENDNVEWDV